MCWGLCKVTQIQKIRVYYGCGWVGPGLILKIKNGKSSQNGSVGLPVLICELCLYRPIHC